jgi:hypothetical protein
MRFPPRRAILLVAAALATAACAPPVVRVPPPRFEATPHALQQVVPVVLALEVQDPPVIGEHLDGLLKVPQYDITMPDLRERVWEHVSAAAESFGLRAQPEANRKLLAQVDLYVQTCGALAGGGSSASAAGLLTLMDARGVIFTHALEGRVHSGGNEDSGAAFVALDEGLRAWFRALDEKLQSDPALAARLQGP